jgi:hypothetical protein
MDLKGRNKLQIYSACPIRSRIENASVSFFPKSPGTWHFSFSLVTTSAKGKKSNNAKQKSDLLLKTNCISAGNGSTSIQRPDISSNSTQGWGGLYN